REQEPQGALRPGPLPQGLVGDAGAGAGEGRVREDPALRRAQGRDRHGPRARRRRLARAHPRHARAGAGRLPRRGGAAEAVLRGGQV
ncbi:hypothetical protein KEM52_004988, partial [Ascosphaera acerosa]